MKLYPIMLFIIASTSAVEAETGEDFWKNCPGPACPADHPNSAETMERASTSKGVKEPSHDEFKRDNANKEPREGEATRPEKTDRKDVNP